MAIYSTVNESNITPLIYNKDDWHMATSTYMHWIIILHDNKNDLVCIWNRNVFKEYNNNAFNIHLIATKLTITK